MFYRGHGLNTLVECLRFHVDSGNVEVARAFTIFIVHQLRGKLEIIQSFPRLETWSALTPHDGPNRGVKQ